MNTPQNTTHTQNPVKRTLWFGMLGAMAALLFVADRIIKVYSTLPEIYRALNNFKEDAQFYAFIEALFTSPYYSYLYPITLVLIVSFLVWLAYKYGYIKKEHLRFRQTLSNYMETHAGCYFGLTVRVTACGIVIFLYYMATHYYLDDLFIDINGELISSYSRALWVIGFFITAYIPIIVLVFTAATLIYVIVQSIDAKQLRALLIVPITGGFVLAIVMFSLFGIINHLELNKRLCDIPGISFTTEPRSVVVLSEAPAIGKLGDIYERTGYDPVDRLPYGNANEKVLLDYLQSKNFETGLRGPCTDFLHANRNRMLDPEGVIRALFEEFIRTGDSITGAMLHSRLKYGRLTEEYRKIVKTLSDESVFQPMGAAAYNIGYAYSKLGEMDKARYWHEKGVLSKVSFLGSREEDNKLVEQPLFFQGNISGKITENGGRISGIRVGVTRNGYGERLSEDIINEKEKPVSFLRFEGVVAGTSTGSDGRFSFTGLGEDEYVLLLSLEDVPGKKYRVVNSPGPIALSEENPSVDVGTIELVLEDENNE